jgi:hypothetical protein
MKFLLGLLLAVSLMSCGGIQTQPTCQLEQYGLIEFQNRSDEYKSIYTSRVIHDGDNYKRVGDWKQRELPPMSAGTIRVHPGMWLVRVEYVDGYPWMKVLTISMCKKTTINISSPVAKAFDFEIKNRRYFDNDCSLCECPILGRLGRYADVLMNHVPQFRR